MKTIKIKELEIEVMRTDEEVSYKHKLKGWKQIKLYHLVYILESKYKKKFLKELDGKYNWFWIKKRKQDKYCSALGGNDDRLHVNGDFDDNSRGRAFGVFVRKLK